MLQRLFWCLLLGKRQHPLTRHTKKEKTSIKRSMAYVPMPLAVLYSVQVCDLRYVSSDSIPVRSGWLYRTWPTSLQYEAVRNMQRKYKVLADTLYHNTTALKFLQCIDIMVSILCIKIQSSGERPHLQTNANFSTAFVTLCLKPVVRIFPSLP